MCIRDSARPERGLDADHRVEPGKNIDERHANFGGFSPGVVSGSGDAHEPADRLHEQVVALSLIHI